MFFALFFTILGFLTGLLWVLSRQKISVGEALQAALRDAVESWKKGGGPDLFHNGRWYKKKWYKKGR